MREAFLDHLGVEAREVGGGKVDGDDHLVDFHIVDLEIEDAFVERCGCGVWEFGGKFLKQWLRQVSDMTVEPFIRPRSSQM